MIAKLKNKKGRCQDIIYAGQALGKRDSSLLLLKNVKCDAGEEQIDGERGTAPGLLIVIRFLRFIIGQESTGLGLNSVTSKIGITSLKNRKLATMNGKA